MIFWQLLLSKNKNVILNFEPRYSYKDKGFYLQT